MDFHRKESIRDMPSNGGRPVKRSGWLTFSAVLLIIAGIMRVFDAIWAFRYNGQVVDNLHDAIFGHSLTAYGWIWLIVGVVLILAGFLVMTPEVSLPRSRAGSASLPPPPSPSRR